MLLFIYQYAQVFKLFESIVQVFRTSSRVVPYKKKTNKILSYFIAVLENQFRTDNFSNITIGVYQGCPLVGKIRVGNM